VFVIVTGDRKSKSISIYGPFSSREEAKDFAYDAMLEPTKILPLIDPDSGKCE
jgi:hypothetical protein